MNKKQGVRIFICIALLAILSVMQVRQAYAFGVTPGKKTVDFEPGLRRQFTLTLVNPDRSPLRATIMAEGELAKYIELGGNQIEFKAGESEKSFTYELFLPQNFEKPGSHKAEIIIRELPSAAESEEIVISSLVAIVSEVEVRVPYPGKYAEAELDIVSGGQNEPVKFYLRTLNLGEQDIEKAKAFVNVYDPQNNLIAIIKTDEKPIAKFERKELSAVWNTNASLGTYRATAVLDYDGVIKNIEKSFSIGDFFISLMDVSVKNFKLGGVAKFNVLAENLANDKVNSVSSEIVIFGEEKTMAKLQSNIVDFEPKTKNEMAVFWDTEKVIEGTYDGKITVKYGEKTSEKRAVLKVGKDKIETEIIGITGHAVDLQQASEVSSLDRMDLLIWGVVILILSNVALIIYFVKFRNKKENL
ncbi:MAG TPA: hypothetical protein VI564_05325 [Candidatus Nanoarchaeia archaeon]|nr:hypothetical protein [Candidatus Nanoarchaeia archaeon]